MHNWLLEVSSVSQLALTTTIYHRTCPTVICTGIAHSKTKSSERDIIKKSWTNLKLILFMMNRVTNLKQEKCLNWPMSWAQSLCLEDHLAGLLRIFGKPLIDFHRIFLKMVQKLMYYSLPFSKSMTDICQRWTFISFQTSVNSDI